MNRLPSFDETWRQVEGMGSKEKHILLGNGFSLGAHPGFAYGSLYEEATNRKSISDLAQQLFERYGTNNFERVLNQLSEGEWLAGQYDLDAGRMGADREAVKAALIEAIAAVHPENLWDLEQANVQVIGDILSEFGIIATVNYDLILYWVLLNYMDDIKRPYRFEDGFRPSDANDGGLNFVGVPANQDGSIRKGTVCYLHGALHFARAGGRIVKRRWGLRNGSLVTQAREAIKDDDPPLFVAEGTWEAKREQIASSAYLAWALEQIGFMRGALFTYGWAMNEQDRHILEAIHANPRLKAIYVGVFDENESKDGLSLRARAKGLQEMPRELRTYNNRKFAPPIDVKFYDARSLVFWKSGHEVMRDEADPLDVFGPVSGPVEDERDADCDLPFE